jgi:hypothetical protein
MSMTENEIKETKEWLQDFIRMFGCNFDDLETRSFNEIVVYLEELQQYRAIGTIEEFKALKEKSVAKMPIRQPNHDMTYEEVLCPGCKKNVSKYTNPYCECGQKLDWE